MLLDYGICQNEDPKSAVVVGLFHNCSKIFPHLERMNFWLAVLTGISDPELCLVFGFHFLTCGDVCSDTLDIHGFDSCG